MKLLTNTLRDINMDCFLGLDIGTSAIKGILIANDGKILAQGKENNSYEYPFHGYVEFDADERYKLICRLIKSLILQKPTDWIVRAISISGASGNALLLDKQKKPIGNAVSWTDQRAESSYQEILSAFSSDYVHSICGWPKIGSFPLAFFAWMKKNKPDVYRSATYKASDFIYYNYKLTGYWAHDTSTATNFYLQEQVNQKYHQPFLDFLEIEDNTLPRINKCGTIIGNITPQAAMETGLTQDTLLIAGSFDHPSAARGTGILQPGDLLISCGTSWVGFYPVENREKALKEKMLIDPFLSPDGPWGAIFSFTNMGGLINNYVNLLFPGELKCFSRFDEAATQSDIGSNDLQFDLTQTIHSPEEYLARLNNFSVSDISRAIMENMAFLMKKKIAYFQRVGMPVRKITMVGGPSESKIWPKILADVIGIPINLINGEFAGCVGAGILAGIGVGNITNEADGFARLKNESAAVVPETMNTEKYQQIYLRVMNKIAEE